MVYPNLNVIQQKPRIKSIFILNFSNSIILNRSSFISDSDLEEEDKIQKKMKIPKEMINNLANINFLSHYEKFIKISREKRNFNKNFIYAFAIIVNFKDLRNQLYSFDEKIGVINFNFCIKGRNKTIQKKVNTHIEYNFFELLYHVRN